MKKYLFGVAIVTTFLVVGSYAGTASAATPITGWAWSSNIGWIKFDTGATSPVTVSTTTTPDPKAPLSGYAWSSNVGWISFRPDDVRSCPSGHDGAGSSAPIDGCNPTMNFVSGAVTGWARVLSMQTENGGGWLQLSGANHASLGGGGVALSPNGAITGYAWEPTALGWVNFIANVGTCTGLSCTPPPATITGNCSANQTSPVAAGTSVTFTAIPTSGIGPYKYDWNNSRVFVPNQNTLGPRVAPVLGTIVKIEDSTGAFSSNLSCPSVSVSQPVGNLDLKIGHNASDLGPSADVHRNENFVLQWHNVFWNDPTYSCPASVTSGGPSGTWGDGLGAAATLNSLNANTGSYTYTISCTKTGSAPISATAILNVISSTEVEH